MSEPRWRVGRKLGRTLYRDDECIGMVDTRALAAQIVDAMNRLDALDVPMVATCFACQPSREGTMASPVPTPTCSKCKKMCIDGYWIDKMVSPNRTSATETKGDRR